MAGAFERAPTEPRRASVFDGRSADFLPGRSDLAVRLYSCASNRQRGDDKLFQFINMASSAKVQSRIQFIHSVLQKRQRWAAITAAISIALSVFINELCIAGEYTTDGPDGRPEGFPSRDCSKPEAEMVKLLQLLFSGILVCLVVLAFTTRLKLQAAERQLKQITEGIALKVGVSKGKVIKLCIELAVSFAQSVPFFHRDFEVSMLGFKMYYRHESIMCGVTFLRLYHVWRWAKLKAYTKYFSLEESYALKDASSIKQLQEKHKKNEMLALKVAISRDPLPVIGLGALILIFVVSYLIRLAEGPAGQAHSTYIWDQVWFVFVTLTTTGYGDITPVSHLGRAAAICIMALGPILTAFITASTTSSLALKSEEQMVMLKMDRNKRKFQVYSLAAQLLQVWWQEVKVRRGLQHRRSSQGSMLAGDVMRGFRGPTPPAELKKELWARFHIAVEELIKFSVRTNLIPGGVEGGGGEAQRLDSASSKPRPSASNSDLESAAGFMIDGAEKRLSNQMEQGLSDVSRALGEIHRRLDALQVGLNRVEWRVGSNAELEGGGAERGESSVSGLHRSPLGPLPPPVRKTGSCATPDGVHARSPLPGPLLEGGGGAAVQLRAHGASEGQRAEVAGRSPTHSPRLNNLLPRFSSQALEAEHASGEPAEAPGSGSPPRSPHTRGANSAAEEAEPTIPAALQRNADAAADPASSGKPSPQLKGTHKGPRVRGDGLGAHLERSGASEAARAVLSELRQTALRGLTPSLESRQPSSEAVEASALPSMVNTPPPPARRHRAPPDARREGKQSPLRVKGGVVPRLRLQAADVGSMSDMEQLLAALDPGEAAPSLSATRDSAGKERRRDDGAMGRTRSPRWAVELGARVASEENRERRARVPQAAEDANSKGSSGSEGDGGRGGLLSDSQKQRAKRAEDRRRLLQVYAERREKAEGEQRAQVAGAFLQGLVDRGKASGALTPRVTQNAVVLANGGSWWEGGGFPAEHFARRARSTRGEGSEHPPVPHHPASSRLGPPGEGGSLAVLDGESVAALMEPTPRTAIGQPMPPRSLSPPSRVPWSHAAGW